MNNTEIREEIKKHNIKHYQVADKLNVSTYTFSHWLQRELPAEKKAQVLDAIKNI